MSLGCNEFKSLFLVLVLRCFISSTRMQTCWWPLSDHWSVHLTGSGLSSMEVWKLIGAICAKIAVLRRSGPLFVKGLRPLKYCKISWSLEAAPLPTKTIISLWNLQQCYSETPIHSRGAWQTPKPYPHGSETSRDLSVRRLAAWWIDCFMEMWVATFSKPWTLLLLWCRL